MTRPRQIVKGDRCAACARHAVRFVFIGRERLPSCPTCCMRHRRGGDFWRTAAMRRKGYEAERLLIENLSNDGLSLRRIARELRIPEATVRSRLKKKD